MKLDTRWLDWQASTEKFEKSAESVPSKTSKMIFGGSEGADSAQNQNFFTLEAEPEAYDEAFIRWIRERCEYRDRIWWGVGGLHGDYATWCDHKGREVPCGLRTFKVLLKDAGLNITDDGLVYGLALIEDLKPFVSESAPSEPPKIKASRK
jgi:hypothetical protein